jgi:hypothetical protein
MLQCVAVCNVPMQACRAERCHLRNVVGNSELYTTGVLCFRHTSTPKHYVSPACSPDFRDNKINVLFVHPSHPCRQYLRVVQRYWEWNRVDVSKTKHPPQKKPPRSLLSHTEARTVNRACIPNFLIWYSKMATYPFFRTFTSNAYVWLKAGS